jgi:flagellin
MPIVVNSNVTATTASFNLSSANDALRNSLARLSSGKRIVNPADDAGDMAVAYKLQSKLERTEAARQNVLVQSSVAMAAQSNQLTSIALTILG